MRGFRDSPHFHRRTGLESEVTGLSQEDITGILQDRLGGQVTQVHNRYNFTDSHGAEHTYRTRDLVLHSSSLNTVVIKPEDNSPTLDELSNVAIPRVIEIVTAPLYFQQVRQYQVVLDVLNVAGAHGTTDTEAVAFQVNVEIAPKGQAVDTELVLTILRNYLRPENRVEIAEHLNVPDIRKVYVGYPQPGFMKRIFSPDYHPTAEQLYMDSMYRSCLEFLNDPRAWTYTDAQARRALKRSIEKDGFEGVLQVLKWNYVRYSSLMMSMFPDEWLTKYLISTEWFKPHPILEFREPNSDFRAVDHVEWILGLVAASKEVGDFTASSLKSRRCALRVAN